MTDRLVARLLELKKKRNAVILAHYYTRGEVQDNADTIGDSLALAQATARTDADTILFCGVHFMAETASITCPDKTVLMPDENSGCPMADMCHAQELLHLKQRHPDAIVICYVNSSASVKALSDICCTSSNAVKIMQSVEHDREIVFVPDRWLGSWTARKAGRTRLSLSNSIEDLPLQDGLGAPVYLWAGYCPTHHLILPEFARLAKDKNPGALLCVHPECRTEVSDMADFVGSTAQILKFCSISSASKFLIGSEAGMLHPLRKNNPGKTFETITEMSTCQNMKLATLEKMIRTLEEMAPQVKVDDETAAKARRPVERMLELS